MASSAKRKNKGKAPAQGYSQDKRLPVGQPFVMHEGASSGVKPSGSTFLQEFVPTEVTYSSEDMVIALQEVLSKSLQLHNGTYLELPNSIKFILDNLQAAFTINHYNLFKKTLQALGIHLVNLTAQNEAHTSHYANLVSENEAFRSHLANLIAQTEAKTSHYVNLVSKNETFESHIVSHPNITNDPYTSQLFSKEEIHSMDKKNLLGTNYARWSLETQSLLRSVVANLPTNIQSRILESKAIFKSSDLWFEHFKTLVKIAIPDPANSDDISDILEQTDWEEHFGSSLRVYEKKHLFPGLLVNSDDGSGVANNYDKGSDLEDVNRSPNWLSQMFEYGFIRLTKLTSHDQASQLQQILQIAIKKFESPFVSIKCWNTLPKWERITR